MKNRLSHKLFALLAAALLVAAVPVGVFAGSGSTDITAVVCRERTVVILPSAGGRAEADPSGSVRDGDVVTFTLFPDEGYVLSAVFLNGEDVTAKTVGNTITVTVESDLVFYAVFVPKAHEHEWEDDFTVEREPTCTEPGSKSIHCKTCPETKDVTPIPPLGHDFAEWQIVAPATCTDEGMEQRACKRCGYTETRGTDPTAHEWEEAFTVDKPPTCEEDGSKSVHCKNCDAVKDSAVIPALGHAWGEGVVVREPTETEEGVMEYTCSRCGKKKEVVLPPSPTPVTGDAERPYLWLFTALAALFALLFVLTLFGRKRAKRE